MIVKLFLITFLIGYNTAALRYISDNELKDLCDSILKSDSNNVANYITMNLQGKTKYGEKNDVAPEKLLKVDKEAMKPTTIAKLLPLYDNYVADTKQNEVVTRTMSDEESTLLDAMLSTTVMKQAKQLLQDKEFVPSDDQQFKNMMHELWFTRFSRGGRKKGSSAFEHIFLGELKNGDISGLHSWIFFNNEESKGRINYLGWSKKMDLPYSKGSIIKVMYSWNNIIKPTGSMFVGTSPELEMALYTVCFFARPNDRCNLAAGGKTFFIQTYQFVQNNKTIIGSAYPGI